MEIIFLCNIYLFSINFHASYSHNDYLYHNYNVTEPPSMHSHGDVILAGLFSVHLHVHTKTHVGESIDVHRCHGEFNRRSFQMVQAMRFAIKEINNLTHLLPGVNIGYDIRDTCQTVESTIRAALGFSFVKKHFSQNGVCNDGHNHTSNDQVKEETVSIIGPDTSDLARAMADFCGLFQVPVISPAATSQLLDDDDRFRYFFRTVPSDRYQVQVFLDFIRHFNWNYVILIVSDDEYGRSARLELTKKINNSNLTLCLVIDEVFNKYNKDEIVYKLKKQNKAKIILLISNLKDAKKFVDLLFFNKISGYTVIGSDAWTKNLFAVKEKSSIFRGIFGVSPKEAYANGYQKDLANALVEQEEHEWVKEFIATEKNKTCSLYSKNITTCILAKEYDLAPYQIVTTYDAVYGIAHALHNIFKCNESLCEQNATNVSWKNLVHYLGNVSFTSITNRTVSFERSKTPKDIIYKIWNLNQKEEFQLVGEWIDDVLTVEKNQIFWNTNQNVVPESVCSPVCPPGTHKHLDDNNAVCCWSCFNCTGNTYSNISNNPDCHKCPHNHWPTKDHTGCSPIAYLYLKFEDAWGGALAICSILANIVLLSTLIIFLKFRKTPVIRASNRGLYYVILLGNCLFFLMPFIVIGKLSALRCKVVLYGIGLSLAVNVGTLLVKTNRIARIFSRKLFRKRKLRWLSLKSQYAMVFGIVLAECLICLIWELLLPKPRVEYIENYKNDIRFMTCDYGPKLIGFAIWGIFNAGLIIVCTYQAFLVRKVPTNYNEAKFIAFTMITICIAIMGYIPVYFGTSGYYRDVVICFLFLFTGCVQYVSLFVPKVYVVIFRPDKNVSMRQKSTSPRMSFEKRASAFESETDYIPSQREIDILKIGTVTRKRKYGFRKKRSGSHVIENNLTSDGNPTNKTFLPLAIKSFTKRFDVFSSTHQGENQCSEKRNGEIKKESK